MTSYALRPPIILLHTPVIGKSTRLARAGNRWIYRALALATHTHTLRTATCSCENDSRDSPRFVTGIVQWNIKERIERAGERRSAKTALAK